MPRSNFDDVGDFHEKFDLDNVTHRGDGPREVPDEVMEFRLRFLREELRELTDAYAAGDKAGMFDALLDISYVAMGTAHLHGFPWQRGWDEVQRANMAKIRAQPDGSDSKRSSSWDVVKPEGWTPPDLEAVLTTPPHQCPQCHRYLHDVTLREVIVDYRLGRQWVDIHCLCGHRLASRPV